MPKPLLHNLFRQQPIPLLLPRTPFALYCTTSAACTACQAVWNQVFAHTDTSKLCLQLFNAQPIQHSHELFRLSGENQGPIKPSPSEAFSQSFLNVAFISAVVLGTVEMEVRYRNLGLRSKEARCLRTYAEALSRAIFRPMNFGHLPNMELSQPHL